MKPIGFSLQMDSRFGAGLTTLDLLVQLALQGDVYPLMLFEPAQLDLDPFQQSALQEMLAARKEFLKTVSRDGRGRLVLDCPVVAPIGNDFVLPDALNVATGSQSLAKVVFENSLVDEQAKKRLNQYDALLAVSRWNHQLLNRKDFPPAHLVPQGIDPTIFHPGPKLGFWKDRFVVFSGGKFEYRKSQDLVVAAFKIFNERHPDSLLCFLWHNFWPNSMQSMLDSTYVDHLPAVSEQGIAFDAWVRSQGLPDKSYMNMGFVSHARLGQTLREMDVALFPNRCEGGTNLIAMEAMACGVPCILSANTGHLDLIASGQLENQHCFVLTDQTALNDKEAGRGNREGWADSSVDEILSHLEYIYAHREEATLVGQRGSEAMVERHWEKCARRFAEVVSPYALFGKH